jgi:hypothetical protein
MIKLLGIFGIVWIFLGIAGIGYLAFGLAESREKWFYIFFIALFFTSYFYYSNKGKLNPNARNTFILVISLLSLLSLYFLITSSIIVN